MQRRQGNQTYRGGIEELHDEYNYAEAGLETGASTNTMS